MRENGRPLSPGRTALACPIPCRDAKTQRGTKGKRGFFAPLSALVATVPWSGKDVDHKVAKTQRGTKGNREFEALAGIVKRHAICYNDAVPYARPGPGLAPPACIGPVSCHPRKSGYAQ